MKGREVRQLRNEQHKEAPVTRGAGGTRRGKRRGSGASSRKETTEGVQMMLGAPPTQRGGGNHPDFSFPSIAGTHPEASCQSWKPGDGVSLIMLGSTDQKVEGMNLRAE